MKYFLPFIACLVIACGPSIPTEDEVRARIVGTYCLNTDADEHYELIVLDSTYQMTKNSPSIMRTGMLTEYCQGAYSLNYSEKKWHIHFSENTSRRRTTIYNCKGDFLVWGEQEQYIGGEEALLWDLFDKKELRKMACE